MGAGGITQRTGFFLVIWVCVTLITSACKASWYLLSLLPCARADKHSDYVPQFGVLLSAPRHAALPSALLLCLHTYLLPFLSVYHPAAPSIHSSMDFTQHQTFSFCSLQPRALGRFLITGTTLGSKGTARSGQADNAIQMSCLLAGKAVFILSHSRHSQQRDQPHLAHALPWHHFAHSWAAPRT